MCCVMIIWIIWQLTLTYNLFMWNKHKTMMISIHVRCNLTKVGPSSVIIDRYWIDEGSQQPVRVNLRRFICLVIESEYPEGATRKPIGTDFPKELRTVVTINDKPYMFILWVPSISKKSLQLGTENFEYRPDQNNVYKRPPLSEIISKIPPLGLWQLPISINFIIYSLESPNCRIRYYLISYDSETKILNYLSHSKQYYPFYQT